jgi:hypothetical protein
MLPPIVITLASMTVIENFQADFFIGLALRLADCITDNQLLERSVICYS